MKFTEQHNKLNDLIEKGKALVTNNSKDGLYGYYSIPKIQFETWMGEINTLNERHLKSHPQYTSIHTAFFHRKNSPDCCNKMIGLLQSVLNDRDFWFICTKDRAEISAPAQGGKEHMNPVVFISHRSTDSAVAEMLRDYLVSTGIPNSYIFCSSLPGNDVNERISLEVKEKLRNSVVNIAILSKSYYESAYCLNEAGIMWYNDSAPVIPIALPEINSNNMYGFLSSEYKLRRLDIDDDVAYIYDKVRECTYAEYSSVSTVASSSKKLILTYIQYIGSRDMDKFTLAPFDSIYDNITTDDERIVLYYILTQKSRRINRKDVEKWLNEEEIYGINIDNAFDLLSTIGCSKNETESFVLDLDIFRRYTADTTVGTEVLMPAVHNRQRLSSLRFVELWNQNQITDEHKLFVAYIIGNNVTILGTRWMERAQIEDIKQWERDQGVDDTLERTYSSCLQFFIENQFVQIYSTTAYDNPREYSLCPSLDKMLHGPDFPFSDEIAKAIKKYSSPQKLFSFANFIESDDDFSDLPF